MKKTLFGKLNIALPAVLVLVFAAVLLVLSGQFDREPVVQAVPDNCYEQTLHVLTDEDYRPYSFYNEDGECSGHDVELIIFLANSMHMNLDLQFLPWDECIRAMDAGEADVLMTCDYSDSFSGTDVLIKSEPVSFEEDKAKSRQAGMNDHVAKPIDINELFSCLAKFI